MGCLRGVRSVGVLTATLVALVAPLALPCAATATLFSNGHLPRYALAPIFIPGNSALLAKRAAQEWNVMRLCAVQDGQELYPTVSDWHPAATAYRTYAEQVAIYIQEGPGLAALPGTSNHGWGVAVDLATPRMRRWIDAHGEQFGWGKHGDAPNEWWHVTFDGAGVARPDPGPSLTEPVLAYGSGGRCESRFVREVQRDLGIPLTGRFLAATRRAVYAFQLAHHLRPGPVTAQTWRALRRAAQTPVLPLPRARITRTTRSDPGE